MRRWRRAEQKFRSDGELASLSGDERAAGFREYDARQRGDELLMNNSLLMAAAALFGIAASGGFVAEYRFDELDGR